MKPQTEMIEGPEAATRFHSFVGKLLSVPHSVIVEREAEYKRKAALNPNRRGPKPKRSASPGHGDPAAA